MKNYKDSRKGTQGNNSKVVSNDDHRNALVAQIARHIYNVPTVICHLDNPQLQIFYTGLGMNVVGYSIGLLQDIQQAISR